MPFFACFSVKIYDGKIKICFLANFSGRILVFFLHLWYDSTMQEKMSVSFFCAERLYASLHGVLHEGGAFPESRGPIGPVTYGWFFRKSPCRPLRVVPKRAARSLLRERRGAVAVRQRKHRRKGDRIAVRRTKRKEGKSAGRQKVWRRI